MNFATFSAVGAGGTHFVTTGGQLPVTKLQQNVTNNGMPQVIGMVGGVNMGEGVQYVRTLDGGTAIQATPQIISVPITLPGTKPGDPQPTVQIQVLNPNLMQQQQPKYQMQIPIQGFQQGGAVLTLAYSPEANESGGIQLIGNTLPESICRIKSGLVLATLPQEMQLLQQQAQESKEQIQQNIQHQVYITPNNEIVINGPDIKTLNNNTSANNNNNDGGRIIIKEESVDSIDDESSQGTEGSDNIQWQLGNNSEDLVKYLNTLPPQQTQQLPVSLQQFLRLNKTDMKKQLNVEDMEISTAGGQKRDVVTEAVLDEDGTIRIQNKKKKKYKKKPPKTPSRPKPGQVIIATASDGTPIYCCPECTMAYPDKSQLEMHLSVHKIERRFICGLCGAGLKRKEHLERHKLGHNPERPYVCGSCGKGFKRREHLNLHAVIHSGVKTEMCGQCGKGFYRKDHLRKHTRSHEIKRARDELNNEIMGVKTAPAPAATTNVNVSTNTNNTIMPEITIHVPTSSNMQPVQINIPQHVVTSLAAAQNAQAAQAQVQVQVQDDTQAQIDALLAHHT